MMLRICSVPSQLRYFYFKLQFYFPQFPNETVSIRQLPISTFVGCFSIQIPYNISKTHRR